MHFALRLTSKNNLTSAFQRHIVSHAIDY
jgi:hypothetical protein